MRVATVVAVVFGCAPLFAAEPVLDERSVTEKVTMLVPLEFKLMGEEMLKKKYPEPARPTIVYTNERGSVNITVQHIKARLLPDQLPALLKLTDATYKKKYPTAEWFRSELTTINGRSFALLELRTPASDTDVRNIIVAGSVDERLLLISFNVTKELEGEWLSTGNKIIESVRIK